MADNLESKKKMRLETYLGDIHEAVDGKFKDWSEDVACHYLVQGNMGIDEKRLHELYQEEAFRMALRTFQFNQEYSAACAEKSEQLYNEFKGQPGYEKRVGNDPSVRSANSAVVRARDAEVSDAWDALKDYALGKKASPKA